MRNFGVLLIVAVCASSGNGTLLRAADITLNAVTDTGGAGWVAILASPTEGTNNCYPCYDPIDDKYEGNIAGDTGQPIPAADPNIALFEGANPGFNSDPNYNASAWSPYSGSWIDDSGTNPFFARDVVDIPGTPTAGSFTMLVDDDSELWINGQVVLLDDDLDTGSAQTADISSYLVSGENVFAFLADNAHGGGYGVYDAYGSITYTPSSAAPEPQSFALGGLGILAALTMARRRVRA